MVEGLAVNVRLTLKKKKRGKTQMLSALGIDYTKMEFQWSHSH